MTMHWRSQNKGFENILLLHNYLTGNNLRSIYYLRYEVIEGDSGRCCIWLYSGVIWWYCLQHTREIKKLIIVKALNGLKSSGAMWYKKLSNNLRDTELWRWYLYFDLFMRDQGNHHKWISVIVDNILIFSKNTESIITPLEDRRKYDLKEVG